MPTPTLVQRVASVFNTATTPKSAVLTAISVGDLIVVKGISEDGLTTMSTAPTGLTGATWTKRVDVGTNNASGRVTIWTATAVNPGTSVSVGLARNANAQLYGIEVVQYASGATVGSNVWSGNISTGTGAPSVTATTTSADSMVEMAVTDWNDIGTAGKTYLTAAAGAFTETTSAQVGTTDYTYYLGRYADSGTAGSKAIGLSAPTGMRWTLGAVEIIGSGGSTFPETMSASQTVSASVSAQITRPRSLAASQSQSSVRQAQASYVKAATETSSAAVTKALVRSSTLAASQTVTAAVTRQATLSRTLTALQTLTAAVARQITFARSLLATQTPSSSVARSPAIARAATQTKSSTVMRSTSATRLATETETAVVSRVSSKGATLAAQQTESVSLGRAPSSLRSALTTQTAAIARSLARAPFVALQSVTPSKLEQVAKRLAVSESPTSAVASSVGARSVTLSVTQALAAGAARSVARALQGGVVQTAALIKGPSSHKVAVQTETTIASGVRTRLQALQATQAQSASMKKSPVATRAAVQTVSASAGRVISRVLRVIENVVAGVLGRAPSTIPVPAKLTVSFTAQSELSLSAVTPTIVIEFAPQSELSIRNDQG